MRLQVALQVEVEAKSLPTLWIGTHEIALTSVCEIVSAQFRRLDECLATSGIVADMLLLTVREKVLTQAVFVTECLATAWECASVLKYAAHLIRRSSDAHLLHATKYADGIAHRARRKYLRRGTGSGFASGVGLYLLEHSRSGSLWVDMRVARFLRLVRDPAEHL